MKLSVTLEIEVNETFAGMLQDKTPKQIRRAVDNNGKDLRLDELGKVTVMEVKVTEQ